MHTPKLESSTHLPMAWGSKSPRHADSLTREKGEDTGTTGEEEKRRASQERGSRKLKRKGKEEEEAEGREYWEGGLRKSWRKGRKNKQ